MTWLTKSRYLSGLQCHKRLWFEVHQPLDEQAEPSSALVQGRTFDEAVQRLHPGVVISRDNGMLAAIAATKTLMGGGVAMPKLMYQPAFKAGDLAVIVDVLRRAPKGFDLIEVKATTAVKKLHILDAAFQALVLKRAGVPLVKVLIGHVNNEFELRQAGHYDGILTEADVTDEVDGYLPTAEEQAVALCEVMQLDAAPDKDIGDHCNTPYDCPFIGRCHADLPPRPQYHVDLLPWGGKVVSGLMADGYEDLATVPTSRLEKALHLRVLGATVTGKPYFDIAATSDLKKLPRPYAYLDFETINLAVPEAIGTHPYEQVPFQWSVHEEMSETTVRHVEFLAIESFGDFSAMAQALVEAIPPTGTVFAYNASFEAGVLNRLAVLAPMYTAGLHGIAERLFDLLPVAREAYYHRDMRGSWSIKSVMPTIDASLDYQLRGDVQDGGAAQAAFQELKDPCVEPERATELRAGLLDYCKHDTWVMVVLRRFLCGEELALERQPGQAE